MARRMLAVLLVGATVAGVFLLSHLSRPPNAHQADDQEEQCRAIEESAEDYEGQLADCRMKLARLRAIEHHQTSAPPPSTLDSTRQAP